MKTVIEAAIKTLVSSINSDTESDEAMRIAQAALNLAHTAAVLGQNDRIDLMQKS